jgi:hypothetical protein
VLINQSINRPTNQNVSRQCALRKQKPRHIIRWNGEKRKQKSVTIILIRGKILISQSAIGPDVFFQKFYTKRPSCTSANHFMKFSMLKTTEMAGIFVLCQWIVFHFFNFVIFFVNWPSRKFMAVARPKRETACLLRVFFVCLINWFMVQHRH